MENDKDQGGAVRGEAVAESHDFTTHRDAWRDAITTMINDEAKACNHDQADYWRHELKAYDRAFASLLDASVSPRAADALDSQPTDLGPRFVAEPKGLSADILTAMYKGFADGYSVERAHFDVMELIDSRAPAAPIAPDAAMAERVRDAVADNLNSLYVCSRSSSAWGAGTMGLDDFSPAENDDDVIANISDAVLKALTAPHQERSEADNG